LLNGGRQGGLRQTHVLGHGPQASVRLDQDQGF
jgi:hypothetical protein